MVFFSDPGLQRFSGNKPHKLTQNGPKRCLFRNFQTHYMGSTMCLWQLHMHQIQKSTEFFLHPQLKRFSGNKPHKLTQIGPKRCIFRNFQPHYLGSTICLWHLFGPFWVNLCGLFPENGLSCGSKKNSVHFWYMGNYHRHIGEPK